MTNLNIQQGLNVEIVSTEIIEKLYNAAKSVPLPLEGEQDLAYMSGNLLVEKTYKTYVSYLKERFKNLLVINVTDGYYILFEDPYVKSILMNNNVGDRVGITDLDAASAQLGTMFRDNTDITKFNEFNYFTKANDNPVGYMFKGCSNLNSINLDNITKLSDREFRESGISTVNMPSLLTIQGDEQFCLCSNLTTVSSLGQLLSLGSSMFHSCISLESVTLPDTITEISPSCFYHNSNLSTINLQRVTRIGHNGFYECKLNSVDAGSLSGLTSIGNLAFLKTLITGILNLENLITLGELAFDRCSKLTGIESLGNITSIPGPRVFFGSGIAYVKIPYGCTRIGSSAFESCSNLTSIEQYNVDGTSTTDILNILTLERSVFKDCTSLNIDVKLPLVRTIGEMAFYNSKIKSVKDLGQVTNISEDCFRGCTSLTEVILPNTVTSLGLRSFCDCTRLSTLTITWENITNIDVFCFLNNPDLNIVLNLRNVTTLGGYSLGSKGTPRVIKQLYVPELEDSSHSYYTNNSSCEGSFSGISVGLIYLKKIKTLLPGTFGNTTCTNLVINNSTPPVWENTDKVADGLVTNPANSKDRVFSGSNIEHIYVPDDSVSTYLSAYGWSTLSSKILSINNLSKVPTENDLINPTSLIEEYM